MEQKRLWIILVMDPDHNPEDKITLPDLYPHLTEEELQISDDTIRRLIGVLIRMAERLCREKITDRDSCRFDESEIQL